MIEQKMNFNYSYFTNSSRVFKETYPEISYGRLQQIYKSLRRKLQFWKSQEAKESNELNRWINFVPLISDVLRLSSSLSIQLNHVYSG